MYQNIYTPIQHLTRPPVHSGGLCWVAFARVKDVLDWPAIHPAAGLAYTDIQLVADAVWYQLKLVDKNRFFSQVKKDTPAGPAWDMQVSGYLGGTTNAHVLGIGSMAWDEFVIFMQDRSGQIRFIGNEDKGAILNDEYNSGDADSSRKTSLQFLWQHCAPAPIYIGGNMPPIFNIGDFNSDFNDDYSH